MHVNHQHTVRAMCSITSNIGVSLTYTYVCACVTLTTETYVHVYHTAVQIHVCMCTIDIQLCAMYSITLDIGVTLTWKLTKKLICANAGNSNSVLGTTLLAALESSGRYEVQLAALGFLRGATDGVLRELLGGRCSRWGEEVALFKCLS